MTLWLNSSWRQLRTLGSDIAGALVYWSGVGRVFESAAQPAGAIILMYHSIAPRDLDDFVDPPNRLPPSRFAEQMGFLRDRRRVVSLSQLVDEVASGTTPPAGTVCITFDDGYLDSLTVAAPILTELRLPATLYLATGYIERQQPQWADALHWLIRRRTAHRLSLPWLPTLDMRHAMSRNTARAVLHQHLLEATEDERAMLLGEVQRQLEPAGSIARTTLTWDEVRRMRQCHPLIEIGGHTRDHVDLRSNRGERAQAQISRCADDLRRELGTTPTHFSYPYARWCDETRNFVRTAGWRSAVGMGDTFRITAASNRFAMPRVEAPRTMTELRFKTSGAYPGALAILGIRAGSSDESASATVGLG